MAIAKGSKSKLTWKEESTYGSAPSGNYTGLTFISEDLSENRDELQSEEITSTRSRTAIRTGNITAGGSISTEFAPHRFGNWMRHLLCHDAAAAGSALSPAAVSDTAYVAGDFVKNVADNKVYICTGSGTVADSTGTDLSHTSGEVTRADGTKWLYVGSTSVTLTPFTITAGITLPPEGITVEKQIVGGDSDLFILYKGGRINSWDFRLTQNSLVKCDWNFLFTQTASSGSTTAGTPVYTADEPFVDREFDLFIVAYSGTVGDTTTQRPLREMNLNFSNNFDESVFVIGSQYRYDLPERTRTISGSFTTFFEDSTEYDWFTNETKLTIVLMGIRRSDGALFKVTIPETRLSGDGTPKIAGDGVISASYNFSAFLDEASHDFQVYLVSPSETTLL